MERIHLEKSDLNRILTIIRRLKKKELVEQRLYLTVHLIRKSEDLKDTNILKQIQKRKLHKKHIRETIAFKNVNWFWSQDKFETIMIYRETFNFFRTRLVSLQNEEPHNDATMAVNLPDEIVVILRFLKICC